MLPNLILSNGIKRLLKHESERCNIPILGMEQRLKVEARINQLEGGNKYRISGTGKQAAKFDKYEAKGEISQYKAAADNTMAVPPKRKLIEEIR